MFIGMLLLGFQLLKGSQSSGSQIPKPDLFPQMVELNRHIKDQSILSISRDYGGYIDEQEKQKKITADEATAKRIEAAILVADTQYKAGMLRKESFRIRAAYYTLAGWEKKYLDKPEWAQTVTKVAGSADPAAIGEAWGKPREWTGQSLYDATVEELKKYNKTDLIWGFIPGGYQFIDFLVGITGRNPAFSYAFAALLLALIVRGLVYPLTQKQLMYSRQMTQLAPLVKDIKEKYKDDPSKQNVKTMELYKEYGINPLAGCGPALIQMPLFLGVYQCMLHYQFEFANGTFLWINKASSVATHGFIAPNLGQLDYILIVIYGASMIITTLLQPVTDPSNIKQQRMIGLSFAIMVPVSLLIGIFPVAGAFVLYWTFTNILATAQSLRVYRMPIQPLVKVNAPGGGTYPGAPKPGGIQGKWMKMMEDIQKAAEEQSSSSSSTKKDERKDEGDGEGGTGTPAKHKPKKRK